MTEKDGVVYTDGKYPNNNVDYIGIRLAEMYLAEAESNIMVKNNTVSAQDVSDVNTVKNRAGTSDVVSGTPGKSAMLEIIFNERSEDSTMKWRPVFNTRELQKSIVNESGEWVHSIFRLQP